MNWRYQPKTGFCFLTWLIGILLALSESLWASTFRVNPVRVFLSANASSQVLTVSNGSDEALRFQLRVLAWNQLEGETQLTETEEIIYFPPLFSLEPGEQRRIRLGTTTAPGSVEKTYRIFVEELPPAPNSRQAQSQINVLTKVGIPIFLQPSQPQVNGQVKLVSVRDSQLSFQINNTGNVHFLAQQVSIQGLDAAGARVFEQQQDGWYVLAGTSQPYDLELPKECHQAQSLVIKVKTANHLFQETVQLPPGACQTL